MQRGWRRRAALFQPAAWGYWFWNMKIQFPWIQLNHLSYCLLISASVVLNKTPLSVSIRFFFHFTSLFPFNQIYLLFSPSGTHRYAHSFIPCVCISCVSIHHLSPKAPSIRPLPCWVPSLLQTQQDERLLERRLLHKLHVHIPVLLERVQSWKKNREYSWSGLQGVHKHTQAHTLPCSSMSDSSFAR